MDSRVRSSRDTYQLEPDNSRYGRPDARRRYPTYVPRDPQRFSYQSPENHLFPGTAAQYAGTGDAVPAHSKASTRHAGRPASILRFVKGSHDAATHPASRRHPQKAPHDAQVSAHSDPYHADPTRVYPTERVPGLHEAHASFSEDCREEDGQLHGSRRTRYEAQRPSSRIPKASSSKTPSARLRQSATSADCEKTPRSSERHLLHGCEAYQPAHAPTSSGVSPPTATIQKRVRIQSPTSQKGSRIPDHDSCVASDIRDKSDARADRKHRRTGREEKVAPGMSVNEVEEEITCPIVGSIAASPCGHVICSPCAMSWIKEHDTCPICREELSQPITSSLVQMRVLDSLVRKWVNAKGPQWEGLAEWKERCEDWEAQRVVWKEDLEAIAQAKKLARMDSSNGTSARNDASLIGAESFGFPTFPWQESSGGEHSQSPFSLFRPDPISSFLDRVRLLDQMTMPDLSQGLTPAFQGFSEGSLPGRDFASPFFDPFSVRQPTAQSRPPQGVHPSASRAQAPPERETDCLLRDMAALLDSLLR